MAAEAPSLRLPAQFMVAGLLAFSTLAAFLAVRFPQVSQSYLPSPERLTVVHLIVLGWGTMVAMGALYQMVPVMLTIRLHSERIGHWQFWLYLMGVTGLITSFAAFWTPGIAGSGTLVAIATGLFIYNLGRTLRAAERRTTTRRYLAASLWYLGAVVAFGLLMAAQLRWGVFPGTLMPNMKTHLAVGAAGWFVLMVIGVSYHLFPMFSLSHGAKTSCERVVFALLNVGIGLPIPAQFLPGSRWLSLIASYLLAAGLSLYAIDVRSIVRARKRPLDLTMRAAINAVGALVLAGYGLLVLNLWLAVREAAGRHVELLPTNGVLAIAVIYAFGFLSQIIGGMLLKIVPFLVWYRRYSPRIGKAPVPLLKDMVNMRVATADWWVYNIAVVVTVVGLIGGWGHIAWLGAGLLAASAIVWAGLVGRVFTR